MDVLSFLRDLPPSGKILAALLAIFGLLAAVWCVTMVDYGDKDDSDDDHWGAL
jgi:hypothetical protein